jgi:hypothetical protein
MIPRHVKHQDLNKSLETFELNQDKLNSAYVGDSTTLKELGKLAEQGRLASEIAPKVAEHVQQIIDGTVAIEQAQSKVLTAAGKGDLDIKKSVAATTLAGGKYVNNLKEHAAKFTADLELEKNRHHHAFGHLSLLAAIASNNQKVDQQHQSATTAQQLEQKQREFDYQHQKQQSLEYLERGSMARELPKKDFLSAIKGFGKSLGF